MKKTLLTIALFATYFINAQYTVETTNGDPITDGQVVEIGSAMAPTADLAFVVTNEGTSNINLKIEVVSASANADPSEMELCFGLCFTGVDVGQSYPINDWVPLAPGQTNIKGDHFKYIGDGSEGAFNYVFRFFEVDGAGNDIGNSLSLTYQYDPALGVEDNTLNVSVYPTVTNSTVNIDLKDAAQVQVFDIQGRVVQSQNLEAGSNVLNVSNLTPQVYLLQFTNNKGLSQTKKIVVK